MSYTNREFTWDFNALKNFYDTYVNDGYTFAGVAQTSTNPGTMGSGKVFYLCKQVGTYTNFSSLEHASGIGVLLWNGTAWSYQNVPSSAVVATDATPTANSTNPVQSGGVWETTMWNIYDPLAGVSFGTKTADVTLRDILKKVWIEVVDQSATLPTSLTFVFLRNNATQGFIVQLVESGTSNYVFSGTASGKQTGEKSYVFNGFSSYSNKIKLHIDFDFSTHTEDLNLATAYLSTTISMSSVNKTDGVNLSVREKIEEVEDSVEDVTEEQQFSNALQGWTIGDSDLAAMIKGAWLQKIDNSVVLPIGAKIAIRNGDTTGSIKFMITIQDSSNNYLFSTSAGTAKSAGLYHILINGFSSYAYKVYLHLLIDLPAVVAYKTYPNSSVDFSQMPTYEVGTISVKDELLNVAKPLTGKTIVCFGDSITENGTRGSSDDNMRYSDWIHQITGANVINAGFGGAQLRQRTTPVLQPTNTSEGYAGMDIVNVIKAAANVDFDGTNTYRDVLTNAAEYINTSLSDDNRVTVSNLLGVDWSKVSAVTIMGGTNDWQNGGGAIGTSGSEDPNYTLGAINLIVKTLLTAYPHLSVYWLTPIVHWASAKADRTASNWGDAEEKNGYTLKAFSAMIAEEATKQHLPVCDLYNTLGWNMWNFSNYFSDTDGTHPYTGYDEIGRKVSAFIIANRTF